MNMKESELYNEFTKLRPIRKQRKWLKNLYEWGNSRYFEAIATKIESKAEGLTEDCINTANGFTVTNVKEFIKVLCAYIRGHALLYDVMREYRYEPTDYSKVEPTTTKPIPAKLATYFRLCDEAQKRYGAMHYDKQDLSDRWADAYYYKMAQVEAAGKGVMGSEIYYQISLLAVTNNNIVTQAALDATRQKIIEINKE